jgi:hypothetical protein
MLMAYVEKAAGVSLRLLRSDVPRDRFFPEAVLPQQWSAAETLHSDN